MVLVEDTETGEQLYIDTRDKKFRRRFYQAGQQRLTELSQTFKRSGVDMLSLSTDEDLVRAIVRFAELRKRTLRKAR